jgi:DNA-binding response OmpR family regulator
MDLLKAMGFIAESFPHAEDLLKSDRDRARALQAGVICYLTKPFNEDALLACIRLPLEDREVGETEK